jgi:hypothetical protein
VADRNLKVQLGARVRGTAKEAAVLAAGRAGISFNEWVEEALLAHAHKTARGDVVGIPLTIDDAVPPGTVEIRDGDTVVGSVKLAGEQPPGGAAADSGGDASPPAPARFSPDCVLREYHWRCGLGNPCKRCGGEK